MTIKKDTAVTIIYFIAFFVLFSVIMALCPLSIDDTYYNYLNLTTPYKILHLAAGYGNGRVLGNLFSIILSKSVLFAGIFRGLIVTLIAYFIAKLITGKKEHLSPVFIFSSVLLICVSSIMFGEVYSWISAFSNYTPPILLTLISIYCIKEYKPDNKANPLIILLVVGMASAAQLFTENTTVNNSLIAATLFLIALIRKSDKRLITFAYAAASALGALVMLYSRLFIRDVNGIYDDYDYGIHIFDLNDIMETVLFNAKN